MKETKTSLTEYKITKSMGFVSQTTHTVTTSSGHKSHLRAGDTVEWKSACLFCEAPGSILSKGWGWGIDIPEVLFYGPELESPAPK